MRKYRIFIVLILSENIIYNIFFNHEAIMNYLLNYNFREKCTTKVSFYGDDSL